MIAVNNYISSLDLSNILDSYSIKYEVDTYCRPGDKDDDCDAYLISNFKDNQDVYLNSLLSYHKIVYNSIATSIIINELFEMMHQVGVL